MFKNDLLLIEVTSTKTKGINKYTNQTYKEFILEPLKAIGIQTNIEQLKFEKDLVNTSSVKSSLRTNANYYLSDENRKVLETQNDKINITYTTQYDYEELIEFIKKIKFEILYSDDSNDHISLILKNT